MHKIHILFTKVCTKFTHLANTCTKYSHYTHYILMHSKYSLYSCLNLYYRVNLTRVLLGFESSNSKESFIAYTRAFASSNSKESLTIYTPHLHPLIRRLPFQDNYHHHSPRKQEWVPPLQQEFMLPPLQEREIGVKIGHPLLQKG